MDIAELSIAMSQSNVQQSVGIELTKIAMDAGEQNAAQMIQTIDASDPNLGNNLDVMV